MNTLTVVLLSSALALASFAAQAEEPAPAIQSKVIETITDNTKGAPMGQVIEADKLTEDSIKSYYDTATRVHLKPYHEYLAFKNRYTAPEAQLTFNITNNMPGKQPTKQKLVMDKIQFVESLPASYKVSQGASINHKMTALKISEDGQTAVATDITMVSNTLTVPQTKQEIHLESQSTCEDSFKVSTASQPLLTKSVCTADTYFFKK